jgi:hypothetical protein
MLKPLASLAVLFACVAPALADEQPAFTALSACRLDPERIVLTYAFEGGACQAVGEVSAAEPRGTFAAVTIPTHETSQMCTMQIVAIAGSAVLDLPEPVVDLDVTALHPDNRVQAYGLIEVAEDDPACAEPAR